MQHQERYDMEELLRVLLITGLFLQAGCVTSQQKTGAIVSVIDTIGGQKYVISAKIGKDGTFDNSVTKDGRTQSLSGQVMKLDDTYSVTVDYSSTHDKMPGLRQINSTVNLRDGESQAIGGLGSEAVYLKISNNKVEHGA